MNSRPDLYPLTFHPILKERVWGGDNLATLYGKPAKPGAIIGESWEISDRAEDESIVAEGPLAGRSLHWLIQEYGTSLLGGSQLNNGRFPLLIKILDAREKLSLQVHPPAAKCRELGGEPKTEMWYVAHAQPGAELYVGLRKGVTRSEFERKMKDGTVDECFHRITVEAGDTMFLPSGRVHALGAGLVIFEIQQNSDTTYRVHDWGRVGLDGKSRELHCEQSLACIDFEDFEPALAKPGPSDLAAASASRLVQSEWFTVDLIGLEPEARLVRSSGLNILGVIQGSLRLMHQGRVACELKPGRFCLIPASVNASVEALEASRFLSIRVTS